MTELRKELMVQEVETDYFALDINYLKEIFSNNRKVQELKALLTSGAYKQVRVIMDERVCLNGSKRIDFQVGWIRTEPVLENVLFSSSLTTITRGEHLNTLQLLNNLGFKAEGSLYILDIRGQEEIVFPDLSNRQVEFKLL